MLCDEMGLGKTWEACDACTHVSGPILIVCRELNKLYWRDTIRKFDPGAKIMIAKYRGIFNFDKMRECFMRRERVYLITHHQALRFTQYDLVRLGTWGAVIIDEVHRIRGRKTQITEAAKLIQSRFKWGLSGTPIEKSPAEWWSYLNWFNPKAYSSYWKFIEKYVATEFNWDSGYNEPTSLLKEGMQEEFGHLLAKFALGRTKQQVAPELPPKIYKRIPVEMTPRQRELYESIRKDTFVQLDPSQKSFSDRLFISGALDRMQYMRKMCTDPRLMGVDVIGGKAEWVADFTKGLDEQVVFFTYFKDYADYLGAFFDTGILSGRYKDVERRKTMDDFATGSTTHLVGTLGTMSESINLQNAHTFVFTELDHSSIVMSQAEDRGHRIDITQSPVIIRLITPDSVDEVIEEALEKKFDDIALIRSFIDHLHHP